LYSGRAKSLDVCRASLIAKEKRKLAEETQIKTEGKRNSYISNAFPEFVSELLSV